MFRSALAGIPLPCMVSKCGLVIPSGTGMLKCTMSASVGIWVQIYARVQFYHFSERAGGTFSCDEGDFVSALIEFFTQIPHYSLSSAVFYRWNFIS